jgi:hypothetical protein
VLALGVAGGVLGAFSGGGSQAVKSAARPNSAVVSQSDRIGITCLNGWLGIGNLNGMDWPHYYTTGNAEARNLIQNCETLH